MSNAPESTDYRARLKKAVLKLDELHSNLDRLHEPIAIIGLSCRMPGGVNDPEAFWQLLHDGVDGVTDIPPHRWDVDAYYDPSAGTPGKMYTRRGGFLDGVDQFDPTFFGIAPREALKMDPQQRILLEVTWEALEHAGQAPSKLVESQTGVFIGIGTSDYAHLQTVSGDPRDIDGYFAAGIAQSIASGRISYVLGLRGPAVSIDTACSSSLFAVHLACQSLRLGDCDMALCGGVNVILSPVGTVAACQTRMLSSDGHCKTFDASADGYARAEGCAVIVLKRLADAQANGDNILALIRGTAANQDGRSNGLTAPNGSAQEAVIREALANSQVEPAWVSYVEAHGTGTSLGDPIEVQALGAVLGEGRSKNRPLLVGAVKTNVGHTEAAAGITGLVKAVLALQHNLIPPTLHVRTLNPLIPWEKLPVQVVSCPTPWEPVNGKRIAGVSAFGFSGTNVHVVIEEAPASATFPAEAERPLHLFTLSARTETALRSLAGRFARHLAADANAKIADVCFTANTGRSHFNHRLAALTPSATPLGEKLSRFATGEVVNGMQTGRVDPTLRPEVVFLFTGQGSQYVGMGRQLYETQATFRTALERCDAALRPYLGHSLLSIFYPDTVDDMRLDETRYTQPALFALEYALAELWKSWGILPSVVMGHSVGEYVAACVAGMLSLEDGLRLIAERGRLMQGLPKNGKMAVVFAGHETVTSAISPYVDLVAIAALNGPENTVISGDGQAVEKILAQLAQRGIKAKPLTVSHAFHSPLMASILDDFERTADQVSYSSPRIGLISNLTGQLFQPKHTIDARYWRRHVREAVQFAPGMETLHQLGYRIFLEIGPDSTLLTMGRLCLPGNGAVWLPSLRRGRDDWHPVLETLAALYIQGVDIDWENFDRGYSRSRVVLPVYPFERERYWAKMADATPRVLLPQSAASGDVIHPLLGRRLRSALKEIQFENQISLKSHPLLKDHRFFGAAVFPVTAYLEMARAAAAQVFESATCVLKNVNVHEALLIPDGDVITMQLIMTPEDGGGASVKIFSLIRPDSNGNKPWTLHVSGQVSMDNGSVPVERVSREDILARCQNQIPIDTYYQMFTDRGVDYGPGFQRVDELWGQNGEAIGHVRLAECQLAETVNYGMHPALFDACFQVFGATLKGGLYMPIVVNSARFYERTKRDVWCHARITEGNEHGAEIVVGDFRLFDDSGAVVADVRGLHFKRAQRESLLGAAERHVEDWLYEVSWHASARRDSADLKPPSNRRGAWVIFADNNGVGVELAERFQEQGEACALVFPGKALEHLPSGEWRVDHNHLEDLEQLIKEVSSVSEGGCFGIIYLWGLEATVSEENGLSELHQRQEMVCGSVLHLVQALMRTCRSRLPRLWLVTRGAQAVEIADSPALVQASLWGLGAAVAIEHPALNCTRIDLDPGCTGLEHNDVFRLFAEICSSDSENQVVIRRGQSYVARLEHLHLLGGKTQFRVDADASYLVTGGLGALGLHVTQWLVNRGARNIVLVGRRNPSPGVREAIKVLEGLGARVHVVRCDVSRQEEVRALLDDLVKRRMPPLRGIVHAAGVLDDDLLLDLNWERFAKVMAPKVDGSWILHQLTKNLQLDFFVLFSSLASVFGNAGQGNYAAANAFLDALAHYRQNLGLPALSINWGPWAEKGMAAALGDSGEKRMARLGISSITPEPGMEAMERLIRNGCSQATVAPIEWKHFLSQFYAADAPSFFSELSYGEKPAADVADMTAASVAKVQEPKGLLTQMDLAAANALERQQMVASYLEEQVSRLLGILAGKLEPREPLINLGFDSLMAVELKSRIEADLGAVVTIANLLQGYSMDQVAGRIIDQLTVATPLTENEEMAISDRMEIEL